MKSYVIINMVLFCLCNTTIDTQNLLTASRNHVPNMYSIVLESFLFMYVLQMF